jgi:hypothetical protein
MVAADITERTEDPATASSAGRPEALALLPAYRTQRNQPQIGLRWRAYAHVSMGASAPPAARPGVLNSHPTVEQDAEKESP